MPKTFVLEIIITPIIIYSTNITNRNCHAFIFNERPRVKT